MRIIRRGSGSVVTWRREIKKFAKSKPADHDLPFPAWSLAKPLRDLCTALSIEPPKKILAPDPAPSAS